MTKQKITDVATVREQQIKSDVQHVRDIAKRASDIAKHTLGVPVHKVRTPKPTRKQP